ncbi:MAG: hypothetical protein HRU40_13120 [Saprospiraceae bacterium]|nr:hypothetical protein [Saprospiraceae bacterium]
MIWKADPDKVLGFVEENFDFFQRLFLAQLDDNVVSGQNFEALVKGRGDITLKRLFEYKLLLPQFNDYRLSEPLRQFLGFLMSAYKPLLPEELDKYRVSMEELLDRVTGPNTAQNPILLRERLDALYDEVQRFLDNVESNTGQLLRATQELKTNVNQLSYSERVQKARHLIEHYIEPLSRILDVHIPTSIANVLTRVSRAVNQARFEEIEPRISDRYAQLHDLLRVADKRMVEQSRLITRELLPMIERLKRESETLNGWMYFLEKPFRRDTPRLAKRHSFSLLGHTIESEVQFFLEQFIERPSTLVVRTTANKRVSKQAYFNRQMYVEKLQQALPLSDYFAWCYDIMVSESETQNRSRFFRLCSLVFEEGERLQLTFSKQRILLVVDGIKMELPRLGVSLISSTKKVG